jgi:hypothetical protein
VKTEPLNMRVHPEQKQRWIEAQQRDRFPDLSSWVRAKLDEIAGIEPGEYTNVDAVGGGGRNNVIPLHDGAENVAEVADVQPEVGTSPPAESVDIEIPQAAPQRLRVEPPEDVPAPPLAKDCVNENMHWRLKRGEPCPYCKGVAK